MRIQVLSDLHLEHGAGVPALAAGVNVVVLAGDLAPAGQRAVPLVARDWAGAERILYIPGNHEFHGSDIEEARRLLASDCAECGVTLLDTAAVTVGGVRFIGATLWTDFRLESLSVSRPGAATGGVRDLLTRSGEVTAEAKACREAGKRLPDFTGAIRDCGSSGGDGLLTTRETVRRHALDRAFIEAEVAAAHEAGLEAVVITHHAPSRAAIHHSYAGSPVNAAYVSDLDALIVHLRPALWIHGHVHNTVNVMVGRTHLIANPRGIGLLEEADFVPDLVVEVV